MMEEIIREQFRGTVMNLRALQLFGAVVVLIFWGRISTLGSMHKLVINKKVSYLLQLPVNLHRIMCV